MDQEPQHPVLWHIIWSSCNSCLIVADQQLAGILMSNCLEWCCMKRNIGSKKPNEPVWKMQNAVGNGHQLPQRWSRQCLQPQESSLKNILLELWFRNTAEATSRRIRWIAVTFCLLFPQRLRLYILTLPLSPLLPSMLWWLAMKSSRKTGFLKLGSYNFYDNRWLSRARSNLAARKAVVEKPLRETIEVRGIINTPSICMANMLTHVQGYLHGCWTRQVN